VVTLWHGRLRMLVTVVAAGLLALGLAVLFDTFAPGSGRTLVDFDNNLVGPLTAAGFPSSSGVAFVTAGVGGLRRCGPAPSAVSGRTVQRALRR
jgi:hypothetical protein